MNSSACPISIPITLVFNSSTVRNHLALIITRLDLFMQQIRQRTSTMMEPMTYLQFGVISGRTLAIFLPAAIMAKLAIF